MGTCLRDNFSAEQIEIVDPSAGQVINKISSKDFGFGATIREKLVAIESKWEQAMIRPLYGT